jgi:glycosyltransferase involved in cell wall biosynthesis
MRIVFFSTDFRPNTGGVAELSHHVCSGLASLGHEVTVLTHRSNGCPIEQTSDGYHIVRWFKPIPFATTRSLQRFYAVHAWKLQSQRAILQYIWQQSPDVVFCGNYHAILSSGVVSRLPCPYFLYLHGEDLATMTRSLIPWRRATLRRSIQRARWTFCNSSFTVSLVHAMCGLGMTRVSATGCGVPLEQLVESPNRWVARQRLGWGDEPVLLTVARLVDNKGVDNVIRALRLVRQQLPDCRYVVAGDGPLRDELNRLAGQLGLGQAVTLMGYVSNDVRDALYEAADLHVMTSRPGRFSEVEGFGITFLEANARGLAVVGSRVGGIPDAVEHGISGMLVPSDDPPALAAAVNELMAHPQRRADMARAGQQRIRDRFNWPAIVNQIERRISELSAGNASYS